MNKIEILNLVKQVDNAIFDALDYSLEEDERKNYLERARAILKNISNIIK